MIVMVVAGTRGWVDCGGSQLASSCPRLVGHAVKGSKGPYPHGLLCSFQDKLRGSRAMPLTAASAKTRTPPKHSTAEHVPTAAPSILQRRPFSASLLPKHSCLITLNEPTVTPHSRPRPCPVKRRFAYHAIRTTPADVSSIPQTASVRTLHISGRLPSLALHASIPRKRQQRNHSVL